MLVLSRKKSETITVDGPAVICVKDVRGRTVSIGIEAEPDVRIVRGELLERDQTEKDDS